MTHGPAIVEALRNAVCDSPLLFHEDYSIADQIYDLLTSIADNGLHLMGWQPIETAPAEVTILVHYDNGEIVMVDAEENYGDWIAYTGKDDKPWVSKPTHWTLPPPAPKKEIEE